MRRFALFAAAFMLTIFGGTFLPNHSSHSAPIAFAAENWSSGDCPDEGNTHNAWGHQERVCELRTTKFTTGSHLTFPA